MKLFNKCGVSSVALTMLFAASSSFADNIVANGSFEKPDIGSNWYVNYGNSAPTNAITGWTAYSVDIVSNLGGPVAPDWAVDGNQAIDLDGFSPGYISQDLTTTPGDTYILSFQDSTNAFGPGGSSDGLNVYWDGSLLTEVTTPGFGTWNTFTEVVTATSATTTIMFSSNISGASGPLIDNVSVAHATPEPSSLALLGLGGIGLAIGTYRRRRVANAV